MASDYEIKFIIPVISIYERLEGIPESLEESSVGADGCRIDLL